MTILKFLDDVKAGYKKGSMYEFVKHDGAKDVFKFGNEYKYVKEEFRGDSYVLIHNSTAIEKLQFSIITLAEHLELDITGTYSSIKDKSKEELIDDFIKMKNLALTIVNNKIVDLLLL